MSMTNPARKRAYQHLSNPAIELACAVDCMRDSGDHLAAYGVDLAISNIRHAHEDLHKRHETIDRYAPNHS